MLSKFHFLLVEEIYFCPMDSETNNFYAQCTDCDKCSFLFSPEEAKYRWLNNDALSIFC